ICVKKKIWVISDEIYEKLIFESGPYCSIASLGKEIFNLTITVNGLSKAYSMTGWRIGYCGGHPDIMEYIKNYQDHSTSNPTSISQAAALQALKEPEEKISAMCQIFKERRDLMTSLFDNVPQVSYIKPQGAFYLFCDFSKVGNASQIAQKMLDEAYVAMVPGDSFGAPGFIRLSYATSDAQIREGVRRISEWIKQHT
ncbi:MAG: aminotransferase class I/II-fold pyridoxal phosphate-dependent enzyme, partial [Candidatus Omnitrophota bacterium]|nr:aminotransferase class I/II-fold pyridoxal phosphate-dependent enzyme [Candidatus Omnitrophota bacterium]